MLQRIKKTLSNIGLIALILGSLFAVCYLPTMRMAYFKIWQVEHPLYKNGTMLQNSKQPSHFSRYRHPRRAD